MLSAFEKKKKEGQGAASASEATEMPQWSSAILLRVKGRVDSGHSQRPTKGIQQNGHVLDEETGF